MSLKRTFGILILIAILYGAFQIGMAIMRQGVLFVVTIMFILLSAVAGFHLIRRARLENG